MTEYLTKDTFKAKVFDYEHNDDWKYAGDLPCVIDFFAEWCGPCKALAPVLETVGRKYQGKIAVYKLDVDKEPELASLFGIQSVPTLLFVPKTGTPRISLGALPQEALEKAIDEVLLGAPAAQEAAS